MATKTKPKRKPREPKPKQGHFDEAAGFPPAPASVPAIDKAADSYCDARDSRMEALSAEIDRKDVLKKLMQEHQLTEYEYDGKVVVLNGEPDVKVKKKKLPKINLNGDE